MLSTKFKDLCGSKMWKSPIFIESIPLRFAIHIMSPCQNSSQIPWKRFSHPDLTMQKAVEPKTLNPKGRWFTYWTWPLQKRVHASFQVFHGFSQFFPMDLPWIFCDIFPMSIEEVPNAFEDPLGLDARHSLRQFQRCDRRGGWGGFSSFLVVVIFGRYFYTANKKIGDITITDIYIYTVWYNP